MGHFLEENEELHCEAPSKRKLKNCSLGTSLKENTKKNYNSLSGAPKEN